MAQETVNRSLNIFIQSGEAQKALDVLLAKEKKLTEEIARTTDPKKLKQLQTELSRLGEPIDRATRKLKGQLSPSINEAGALVRKLGSEFLRMSKEDPE